MRVFGFFAANKTGRIRGLGKKSGALERIKKYCSGSGEKEGERSFWVLASFQLSHRVFQTCSFAEASPKHQKSPLRTATLFFKTL